MQDYTNIPGGAVTQMSKASSAPKSTLGLTQPQAQQAADSYESNIARGPDALRPDDRQGQTPIPTGLEEFDQQPQEQQEPDTEEVDVTLPSGEEITVVIPKGMTDEEIRYQLIDNGEKGFTPDGTDWERAAYGFEAGENITTNTGTYVKSHYPFFSTEIRFDEDGISIDTPEELYGEDYMDLSPQQRRERMAQVEAENLQKKYPDVHPKNLGKAGVAGTIAKGIADPAVLLPGGQAAKAVNTYKAAAKTGAAVGASWGGAFGLSEVAAESGAPTTIEELKAAAPKVLEPAVAGAVLGPVVGVGARSIARGLKPAAHKASFNPEKAAKFMRGRYWPAYWQLQMEGKSASEASNALRKKFKMSLTDEWRLRQSLVDVDESYKVAQKFGELPKGKVKKTTKQLEKELAGDIPVANRQGTSIYAPGDSAADAAKRLGEAKMSGWGDPILHGGVQTHIDEILRPIAGVVKDISPRIYSRLINLEGNIPRKTHEYHMQFKNFMKGTRQLTKKASPQDIQRFSSALYNNNPTVARNIWLQYGMDDGAFKAMQQGMQRLTAELKSAGVDIKGTADYFPRIVKDYAGFRAHIHRNPKLKGLEKRLAAVEKQKGRKLTDSEQTAVINNYMTPRKQGSKQTVGSTKKRNVKEVTRELLQFYHDPATSLEFHLREAISKAERNKLFGKHMKVEDGVDDLSGSIGSLVKAEGLDHAATQRLQEVLGARFGAGEQSGNKFWSSLRQTTGGLTLGNPISAIRQLGDVPSIMKTQGVANTMAALFKRTDKDINADAFGYMLEMAQELDTKNVASHVRELSQFMYKYGGFRSVDRFGKNTMIKAAQRKLMNSQKTLKSKVQFAKDYSDIYTPKEMAQLIDDINNRRVTDLVKSHLNAEIMKVQPISRSQMSQKYLEMPNGRMMWQFRTWGLNQIELFRQQVWRGLKSKDPQERRRAARAGVAWVAGIGVTNTAITQAQRFLTGRDEVPANELPDEIIWQSLGNFGIFDRYGMEKAAETGDIEQYLNTFLPPALTIPGNLAMSLYNGIMGDEAFEKEAFRDIMKQWGMGRIIDYMLLGGAEEYNEKKAKKRKEEENKEINAMKKQLRNPYAQ